MLPGANGHAAADGLHPFSGTLDLGIVALSLSGPETTGKDQFPGFSMQFISVGDALLRTNGVSAFRFADGDVHDPAALALATAGIRPFC